MPVTSSILNCTGGQASRKMEIAGIREDFMIQKGKRELIHCGQSLGWKWGALQMWAFPRSGWQLSPFLSLLPSSPSRCTWLLTPFLLSSPNCLCSGSVVSHAQVSYWLTLLQRACSALGLPLLLWSVYVELKIPLSLSAC